MAEIDSPKIDRPFLAESLTFKVSFGISVAAVGLFFGWLGAMANEREVPVITRSMETLTPEVSPGDKFRVRYTMVRNRNCKTHIDRFIFDGEGQRHVLAPLDFINLPLGEDQYTVPVDVPIEAAVGRARYTVISTYVCNPLQEAWPIKGNARDIWFVIR